MMRLKELRQERELTQWDVANGIQTGQRNIGRWERGEVLPSADYVVKLADFFEVSADYLLGRSDDFGNVSIQRLTPELKEDEGELLSLYRSLMPDYKALALTNLRTWAGGGSPAKNAFHHKP